MKKTLVALLLLMLPVAGVTKASAQTAGQSVTGFLLAQGSTYNGYTCPSANTSPCFVQYGASLPTTPGAGNQTVDIDQTTPGTTNGVQTNAGSVTANTNTPSATVGLTPISTSVVAASVSVSGAHGLYDGTFSSTVAGWLFIYNATSCSANGTVIPEKAIAYPAANQTIGFSWGSLPLVNSTGITACFSTTGPFTATSSATAFISLDYK